MDGGEKPPAELIAAASGGPDMSLTLCDRERCAFADADSPMPPKMSSEAMLFNSSLPSSSITESALELVVAPGTDGCGTWRKEVGPSVRRKNSGETRRATGSAIILKDLTICPALSLPCGMLVKMV